MSRSQRDRSQLEKWTDNHWWKNDEDESDWVEYLNMISVTHLLKERNCIQSEIDWLVMWLKYRRFLMLLEKVCIRCGRKSATCILRNMSVFLKINLKSWNMYPEQYAIRVPNRVSMWYVKAIIDSLSKIILVCILWWPILKRLILTVFSDEEGWLLL